MINCVIVQGIVSVQLNGKFGGVFDDENTPENIITQWGPSKSSYFLWAFSDDGQQTTWGNSIATVVCALGIIT